MNSTHRLQIVALPGIPLVQPGDDLAALILDGLARAELSLQDGDALVVASKIISKAEGRMIDLSAVTPSAEAQRLAAETDKDPRVVELVLQESGEISRQARGVLVVQHRLGYTSANAAIDQSNVDEREDCVLLLPADPDASARALRERLGAATGADVGIVVSDSHGRPFRMGNVGVALGVAGMPALLDLRGQHDLFGRELKISMQGYADLVASAAQLLSGEGDEGRPVMWLRGLNYPAVNGGSSGQDLIRPNEQDLYR